MTNRFFYFLILVFLFVACKSLKKGTKNSSACFANATVKDYAGLDGCTYLIVLDKSGEKLQPLKVQDKSFVFENNQFVKIAYKEMPDVMTTCMAGKAVEITCIELMTPTQKVVDKPMKRTCVKLESPFDIAWMRDALIKSKPKRIDRYTYLGNGYAYRLLGAEKDLWYDCQGNLICEIPKGETPDCQKEVQHLGAATRIWEANK